MILPVDTSTTPWIVFLQFPQTKKNTGLEVSVLDESQAGMWKNHIRYENNPWKGWRAMAGNGQLGGWPVDDLNHMQPLTSALTNLSQRAN